MDNDTKPAGLGCTEQLGQVPERAKPRAWAIFVDRGNARMWSTLQPHVQRLADAEGLTITPLYDQGALDAAAGLERARTAAALAACAIAQQCIKAAYEDQWASFDALSDDFDDALAAVAEAGGPNAKLNGTP